MTRARGMDMGARSMGHGHGGESRLGFRTQVVLVVVHTWHLQHGVRKKKNKCQEKKKKKGKGNVETARAEASLGACTVRTSVVWHRKVWDDIPCLSLIPSILSI